MGILGGVRDNLAFISIFLWGDTLAFYYAFVILRIKGIRRKCSVNQFHLNFVKPFYWYFRQNQFSPAYLALDWANPNIRLG